MHMRIKRLRRHLWIPAGLMVISVLAVGARNIADELSSRPLRQQETERKLREWSRHIVGHMDGGSRNEWQALAERDPHAFIRACAIGNHPSAHHE